MKRLITLPLLLALVAPIATAQELQATVSVNTEPIPSAMRDYLRDFKQDVENYLNGTTFTDEDMLGDKIQCTFEMFFQRPVGENRYIVQVFVGSQRMVYVNDEKTAKTSPILRVLDEKWEIQYQPGQRMRRDDFSFDALTDFLDFYAYLIIGLDLETYAPSAGTKYFQKAFAICELGSNSSTAIEWKFASSPYNRYGMAEELTNPKYSLMREAFTTYHFDGIDLLGTQAQRGLDNMLRSLETIAQVRKLQNPQSVFVRQFFNAKNKEIAEAFLKYNDRSVFEKLGEYDPEHLSSYQDQL